MLKPKWIPIAEILVTFTLRTWSTRPSTIMAIRSLTIQWSRMVAKPMRWFSSKVCRITTIKFVLEKIETNRDSDRTKKQSEGFYLTPFILDGKQFAEEFQLTAEVSACPHGPYGGLCTLGADCETRYDGVDWYTNHVTSRRRRRQDTGESQTPIRTSIKIIDVYHPCKYVSEDVSMCITDDNGELGKGAFFIFSFMSNDFHRFVSKCCPQIQIVGPKSFVIEDVQVKWNQNWKS